MSEAEQLDQLILRTRNLPHRAAVREVRDYFRALPPEAARALAEDPPEQLSALEGAPPQLRYDASRKILLAAHRRLRDAVDSGESTPEQRKRLDTVTRMLWPVKGLGEDASGNRVVLRGSRQFLYVDPDGQGGMIEVLGDLEKARHVVVLIPGMNNDLDKVQAQMDRAHQLREELGTDTAVVVWKPHRAPIGLEEGMSSEFARAAVPLLSRFEAGLDAVRAAESSVTFIGNSYGSQILGRALMAGVDRDSADGVSPDKAILIGCPGIDESVTTAAQITPPGTKLFIGRARGDYVSYAQQHGPDPADFPDAFRFATEAGKVKVTGHMKYFKRNSESLRNIVRICRNQLAAVTPARRTTPEQESRLLPGISWADSLRKLAATEAAEPIATAFDGVATLSGISSSALKKPGSGNRAGPGTTPRRPEGPAR